MTESDEIEEILYEAYSAWYRRFTVWKELVQMFKEKPKSRKSEVKIENP